jgi:hypothetical protein
MNSFSTRRSFLASALALGAWGCSSSQVARTVGAYWDRTSSGDVFTRAQVEQLPYPCLAVSLGGQARALVVLAFVYGDVLQWFSADRGALLTRHGRLIRSVGLAAGDLGGTFGLESDPLNPGEWPRAKAEARNWQRQIDLMPSRRMGVSVTGYWQPLGESTVATYWGERQLLAAREDCVIGDTRRQFSNRFWLDPTTGKVVISEQYIDAHLPTLRIEVLKGYGLKQ